MGKRLLSVFFVFVLILIAGCGAVMVPRTTPTLKSENLNGGSSVQAATNKKYVSWNTSKSYTVTKGSFKFYTHLSKDKKKAWVYKVTTKKKKATPKSLNFPKKIKKASVVRIGGDMTSVPVEDLEFYFNVFGCEVDAQDNDAYCRGSSKIKTMTLPSTVTEIDQCAFGGMWALTKVKIPDKVKTLESATFYGCKKLKEVKLPKNFTAISDYSCFDACPKLEKISISKKNKKFTVKNGFLLTKDEKKLVWVVPKNKTIAVPDSVTTIETDAFCNSNATSVMLGKNINNLKKKCLSGKKIKKILIDNDNPIYAIDGQCVYRRMDGLLTVAIAKVPDPAIYNSAELVISDKVKKITTDASLCGTLDTDGVKLLDISASVTWLGIEWLNTIRVNPWAKVYFRGTTPPQMEEGGDESSIRLPVLCEIYVPKASLVTYQDWYKKNLGLFIKYYNEEDWHTF